MKTSKKKFTVSVITEIETTHVVSARTWEKAQELAEQTAWDHWNQSALKEILSCTAEEEE